MPSNNVLSLNGSIKNARSNNVNSNTTAQHSHQLPIYNPAQMSNGSGTNSFPTENINFEKTAIELSLNILGMEHSVFESMPKHEFMYYYDNYKKNSNNVNKVLAAKIAYKHKMSCCEEVNSGYNQVFNNPANQSTTNNFYQPELYRQGGYTPFQNNSYNQNITHNYNPQNPYPNPNSNKLINTIKTSINESSAPHQSIYHFVDNNQNQNNVQSKKTSYVHTNNQNTIQKNNETNDFKNYNPTLTPNMKINSNPNPNQNTNILTPNDNFRGFVQTQPNYKPSQNNVNESKYLISDEQLSKMPTSKEFDINGVINNYVKQKNNGMGRNIDSSFR